MTKRILVVDDEPDAVEFAREILEGEGYEVISASDGQKGLSTMRSEKPDLVILDVQMLKMMMKAMAHRNVKMDWIMMGII